MVDNAEWSSGLNAKFGIQHVDFKTLKRTYKRSAIALCMSFPFDFITLSYLSLAQFFKGRLH